MTGCSEQGETSRQASLGRWLSRLGSHQPKDGGGRESAAGPHTEQDGKRTGVQDPAGGTRRPPGRKGPGRAGPAWEDANAPPGWKRGASSTVSGSPRGPWEVPSSPRCAVVYLQTSLRPWHGGNPHGDREERPASPDGEQRPRGLRGFARFAEESRDRRAGAFVANEVRGVPGRGRGDAACPERPSRDTPGGTEAVSRASHAGCVAGTVPGPSQSPGVLGRDPGKRGRRRGKGQRGPARPSSSPAGRPRGRSATPGRRVRRGHPGPRRTRRPAPAPGSHPRRPTQKFRGRGPGPAFSNTHTQRQVWKPLDETPSKGLSRQTSRDPMSLTLALANVERDLLEVTSAGTFLPPGSGRASADCAGYLVSLPPPRATI